MLFGSDYWNIKLLNTYFSKKIYHQTAALKRLFITGYGHTPSQVTA